ncbi:MAG: hypothetical protein GY822_19250 [Deltaproteobacteria bacterium]|nr:hypothetical protein [Deltaproteobacteria bacterium]
MKDLDDTGRKTLDSIVNLDGEEAMLHITQEQAEKLLLPTKRKAEAFQKTYPVFSYVARVGKDVFWRPANPWRAV